jgi:hypothetical protein
VGGKRSGCGSREVPLSLVELVLQADQEVMGEKDQRHVMIPPRPEAQFVVIQAQVPFTFREAGLDGPAHSAQPDQSVQRRVGGGIAQVVFERGHLGRTVHFAAQHHPNLPRRQAVAHRHRAHGGEVGHQRSLAALQDAVALPARRRQVRGDAVHALFGRAVRMHTRPPRSGTFARGGLRGHPRLGRGTRHSLGGLRQWPDLRVAGHLRQIAQV